MFVGTFEHSLDDKGRVVLPSAFRAQLHERGYLAQLDTCLGLWTVDGFADVTERLTGKIREGLAPQEALRSFAANAHEVRPDSQGRITIPQRLRTYASLDRDAVLIGNVGRAEIWDVSRWSSISASADESLSRAVTDLGL